MVLGIALVIVGCVDRLPSESAEDVCAALEAASDCDLEDCYLIECQNNEAPPTCSEGMSGFGPTVMASQEAIRHVGRQCERTGRRLGLDYIWCEVDATIEPDVVAACGESLYL